MAVHDVKLPEYLLYQKTSSPWMRFQQVSATRSNWDPPQFHNHDTKSYICRFARNVRKALVFYSTDGWYFSSFLSVLTWWNGRNPQYYATWFPSTTREFT